MMTPFPVRRLAADAGFPNTTSVPWTPRPRKKCNFTRALEGREDPR